MTDFRQKDLPQLRVWWIPQVPMKPFEVFVSSFAQAKVLLEVLAQYDRFQLQNHIKPDYSNAGGLQVFEDGEWSDFWTDEGEDIDEVTFERCLALDLGWRKIPTVGQT